MIGKILEMMTAGSALASVGALHRFMSSIVSIVILTLLTAFLLCVLIGTSIAMGYLALVHFGLDPFAAAMVIGLIAFLIASTAIGVIIAKIQKLRNLSSTPVASMKTGVVELSDMLDAFVDGFLNPHK
jgi:ABC-type multidrug transport system fused ATPase/permease subunit